MKPLRILMVQETDWLIRNVIQPHHLLERLAQRGHTVQIIDYDIRWPERIRPPGWQPRQVFPAVNRVIPGVEIPVTRPAIVHLPLVCHLSYAVNSLIELRRVLHEARPDVVIGYSLTNSYPMALMLKKARIPFVYMILEPYHTMMPQRWIRPAARLVEGLAERAADRLMIFTPQMAQYLQRMGVQPERIVEFKTGVSLDVFRPEADGTAARAALGIGPKERVLFFMGWLYDFSGLREILEAICQNPGLLNKARLLIVGDGDIYHELQNVVEQHQLGDRVILTGRRPYAEIPELLAAADVCLIPSLENDTTRDIVPMKVYEYLAAGKPMVASRLPGMLAEFGHDHGILYTGDPLEALQASLGLAEKPDEARHLAQAGRGFAEQNANWEGTTDQLEQMLAGLRDQRQLSPVFQHAASPDSPGD